ncbi:ribonuclease H-like domain-containing protein [Protomyces lactucae-debilis]|uniref:Ribonuclease H-like domain-containing protein n=1 Tax=Protomyces lactucae-debilis TaxID=2754530 RepID=A0A1Y2EXV3_PROLT|nr:ribonuclease H-like domain-containing protein [Protomyces lactucae-debilis]ORY76064.1 ribonuclease H-like domain-containing protein [Protomyces lactucae-debilis]
MSSASDGIDAMLDLLKATTLQDDRRWTPPRPRAGLATQQRPLRYLLVMDVEATCDAGSELFAHEIIELPVMLLDLEQAKVLATFHRFVKPRKALTRFCTALTGISQQVVDAADSFDVVLSDLTAWLEQHTQTLFDPPLHDLSFSKPSTWFPRTSVGNDHRLQRHFRNWAFATDGIADVEKFIWLQARHSKLPIPNYFYGPYVDTRGLFAAFMKQKRCTLAEQGQALEVTMEGQAHSGLDDTKNIARICLALYKRGCVFEPNRVFYKGHKAWIKHQRYKER